MDTRRKLIILADAAKYDASCASSGTTKRDSSDGQGILSERVPLNVNGQRCGFYQDRAGGLIAFHATPGYETYKGLGWYGVITGAAG